jgi:hypothetical protein
MAKFDLSLIMLGRRSPDGDDVRLLPGSTLKSSSEDFFILIWNIFIMDSEPGISAFG